jgi:uncharacterized protein (TIGR03437 family)
MKEIARLLAAFAAVALFSPQVCAATYSRVLNTGTANATTVNAMTVDALGNVYLTGSTTSSTLPTTPGVVQPNLAPGQCSFVFDPHSPPEIVPCSDAFVVKLDPLGNVVFATYLGGSGSDAGQAIAVDSQGSIYVAGTTHHDAGALNDFPTTPGAAFRNESTLIRDAFVTKLNPLGTAMTYSTLVPGAGYDSTTATVDPAGNVTFGGNANPTDGVFPTTSGAFQTTATTQHEHGVIAKFNANGSALLFSTYIAGSSFDFVSDVAIDPTGNIYVVGSTFSADFPVTAGAFQTKQRTTISSAFIAKLNPTGSSLIYSTFVGGSDFDGASRVRIDSQGNAIVFGNATSTDFPVTSGVFQSGSTQGAWTTPSGTRAFVLSLNAQGSALNYSTFFDGAAAFATDAAGNAYVAGSATYGFPATRGATQSCNAGAYDAIVAQLDGSGKLAAATYFGGALSDAASAVVVGADGSVYVAGSTNSPDFPNTQPGAQSQTTPYQTFISKLQVADPTQPDFPCMAHVAQNGATFIEGPISPGELITLRGTAFGPNQGSLPPSTNGGFPSQLGGVRVLFDGIAAPLLYTQSQQINVQVPWELSGASSTQVHVEYNGASSNAATFAIAASSPGVFYRFDGTHQGAIINADGTPNSPANPAARGSTVSVYATGAGLLNPAGTTGAIWPLTPLSQIALPVTVMIGPQNAVVSYAGSAPLQTTGLVQLNVQVPTSLNALPTYQLAVTIGNGSNAAFPVTIAVR